MLRITKVRLMKRAVDGVKGVDQLLTHFKEQVGLVFASDEISAVAKVLHEFAEKNEALKIVIGCFDSTLLDEPSIVRIASLPSKKVLLAQVCSAVQAPVVNLVRLLNMKFLSLYVVLKQIGDKK